MINPEGEIRGKKQKENNIRNHTYSGCSLLGYKNCAYLFDFQSFPVLLKKIRVFLYLFFLKTRNNPEPLNGMESVSIFCIEIKKAASLDTAFKIKYIKNFYLSHFTESGRIPFSG
jgi:hypothetical protein